MRVGESRVELLASLGDDTPVGKFLAKRGPGHAPRRLRGRRRPRVARPSSRAEGAELIDSAPRHGLFGLEVAFVHPDAAHGVLVGAGGAWLTTTRPGRDRLRRAARSIGEVRRARAADELEPALAAGEPRACRARRRGRPLRRRSCRRSRTCKRFAAGARVGFGACGGPELGGSARAGHPRAWPSERAAAARVDRRTCGGWSSARQQGDRDALEELYLIHFDRIYSYLHMTRRQPARRRGPDDADLPEDAGVDRQVPLAVGAVLGLALPDRAQPRDGPLPRAPPLAARGGGAGAARARRSPPRRSRRCRRSAARACSS